MSVDPAEPTRDERADLADVVEQELDEARASGDDDPTNPPASSENVTADPGEVEWYESDLRNLEGAVDREQPPDP